MSKSLRSKFEVTKETTWVQILRTHSIIEKKNNDEIMLSKFVVNSWNFRRNP